MSAKKQEELEEEKDISTPADEAKTEIVDKEDEKEPEEKEEDDSKAEKPEPEENSAEEKEPEKPKQDKTVKKSRRQRLWAWYKSHKKWSIPLTVLLILIAVGAIPWSRYHTAGLVYKKDFVIQAIDSTTNTPVSGAQVTTGAIQATTDNNGKVMLHLPVGPHTFTFSKKYYQSRQTSIIVPILSEKGTPSIPMQATGRQVKITVKNVISKKVLAGANIKIADTEAKTDDTGSATIVLPVGTTSQKATVSLDGYNDVSVTVQISNTEVKQNDFTLTPAGKVYFLSKRTGGLDVMKTDLDGNNAQTVLAGTGSEQIDNTVISASADWKYVALLTRRDASMPGPQVYVISTADDRLLTVDSGSADFGITGWAGDNLIYAISRNDVPAWQANKYKLKSYDATTGKITLLDQTTAVGDVNGYSYEYYSNVLISGGTVVYFKDWSYVTDKTLLNGKQSTVSEISPSGQNHKIVTSFDAASNTMAYIQHSPNAVYIWQQAADSANNEFLDYVVGSSPKQISFSETQFYQRYPTYYWSFSGKQAFWNEMRDGNTLIVGDSNGANAKSVLSQSDYMPYGWYNDQYLLVSKNGSELYVMPVAGGTPLKISNYQQMMTGI
jgi:hypothetical protein